ncbi:8902_t:CDS:2 [Rhizophagus irregularis]|nr:8902_t:CDS:2 [Rhizophagus irregularis]
MEEVSEQFMVEFYTDREKNTNELNDVTIGKKLEADVANKARLIKLQEEDVAEKPRLIKLQEE